MDFNLVVLAGALAVPADSSVPTHLDGEDVSGSDGPGPARLLMTVRSRVPQVRVDLIPVLASHDIVNLEWPTGTTLWVAGALQRRFNPSTGRSTLQVVARHIDRCVE